jgi:hypothetical protein
MERRPIRSRLALTGAFAVAVRGPGVMGSGYATTVSDDRDPLSGAERGDPTVAVRLGLAAALSHVLMRMGMSAVWLLAGGRSQPLSWVEWKIAFAVALPVGAALILLAWRDRPGRAPLGWLLEALLLGVLVWVAAESWAFFFLSDGLATSPANWWFVLTDPFHVRIPQFAGQGIGLLLAARWRGHRGVGAAFEVPTSLGAALTQRIGWPDTFQRGSLWGTIIAIGLMIFLLPLAERGLRRLGAALLERDGRS